MIKKVKPSQGIEKRKWLDKSGKSPVITAISTAAIAVFTIVLIIISVKQLQFYVSERKAALEGNIICRFINWWNYFDIEDFSWDGIGKGEKKDFTFRPKKTVQCFVAKLGSARHDLLFKGFSSDNEESQGQLLKREAEIRAEFIEKMGVESDKYRIRKEDGHLHLSMTVVIHNPREVPVTITDIRCDLSLVREKYGERFILSIPSLHVEPELYEIKSDRSLTPLVPPFTIDRKGRIVLLVSFKTYDNVLDLSLHYDELKDKATLNKELNILLKTFYYMGIEINGEPFPNRETECWPEFTIKHEAYPWYFGR